MARNNVTEKMKEKTSAPSISDLSKLWHSDSFPGKVVYDFISFVFALLRLHHFQIENVT